MSRAIILDYRDGSICILPIPEDIPDDKQGEYVENHPCYDSNSQCYMIVGESADIYAVSSEETVHKENGIVCYESKPTYEKIGEL